MQIGNTGGNTLVLVGTTTVPCPTVIRAILSGSATLDFATTGTATCDGALTIPIQGVPITDGSTTVSIGFPNNVATTTGSIYIGHVSNANTVAIRHCNISGDSG